MLYILYLLYYTHIPYNILNKAYYILVAELAMARVCYGPSLYGPSLLWAEFVMGRVCYGPRCPVTWTTCHVSLYMGFIYKHSSYTYTFSFQPVPRGGVTRSWCHKTLCKASSK